MLPSGKVAGGAPFNIVNRATALGARAEVISSLGKDVLGDELIQLVGDKGNSTTYIQRHPSLPTSVVEIKVQKSGEPHYDIIYPVAWDDVKVDGLVQELVQSSEAFIYSSLGLRDARSREALFKLLPKANLKICDINLRDGHYEEETIMRMIAEADILRMNETELAMISEWSGIGDLDRKMQISALSEFYDFEMVIATLGGEGAVCYYQNEWHVQPVFKVKVKDTVGAGDAFLASFIHQYLKSIPVPECLRYACAVGALTAAKDGGTPIISNKEIALMLKT